MIWKARPERKTFLFGGGNAGKNSVKKSQQKEGKSFRLFYLTWPPALPRLRSIL
jgi:hypothetical protein